MKLLPFIPFAIFMLLLSNTTAAEPIKIGRVLSDSTVTMPTFQLTLTSFKDVDNKLVDGWNQYSDASKTDELILVTGASFDMHFRQYSTYAIGTREHSLDDDIQTPEQALNFSKKTTNWNKTPSILTNQHQATCVGESNQAFSSDDGFIYDYKSLCFNFKRHVATEINVSISKLDKFGIVVGTYPKDATITIPISPEFIQFTKRLFDSYEPL